MTNLPPPESPGGDALDELASALLDGEAMTSEESAAGDDQAVSDRVDAFAAVRAALADTPAPLAEAVDRAVAAALATAATERAEAVPAPVVTLRPRRSRWVAVGAAAAGLAALVGLAAVVTRRDDTTGGESETASPAAATTVTDQSSFLAGPTTTAAAATTAAAPATTAASTAGAPSPVGGGQESATDLPDLGEVGTVEELRELLTGGATTTAASRNTDSASSPPCALPGPPATTTAVGTARFQGVDAVVFVIGAAPARAIVLARATCQPLAEVGLP